MNTNIPPIKLSFTSYLGILFLMLLLISVYTKDIIISYVLQFTGEDQIRVSEQATKATTDAILSLDKISFDTTVLGSPYLENIVPFPSFPMDTQSVINFGKANPFIGSFIVVTDKASSSVGAVVYSNQRSANEGNSIRTVNTTNRR